MSDSFSHRNIYCTVFHKRNQELQKETSESKLNLICIGKDFEKNETIQFFSAFSNAQQSGSSDVEKFFRMDLNNKLFFLKSQMTFYEPPFLFSFVRKFFERERKSFPLKGITKFFVRLTAKKNTEYDFSQAIITQDESLNTSSGSNVKAISFIKMSSRKNNSKN